jgi:Phage gp6-like head-tail connector protein
VSRYATLNELKRYLQISGTIDDALLQECLDRAEGVIDAHTRRAFVGTAGTRFFNRYESDRVRSNTFYLQEDLHTLTQLILGDGQNVPIGSVWLQPREGPPYRGVQLKSQYVYTWNTDQDMVMVGTWGVGTVAPPDIQHATIRQAMYEYRSKDVGPTDVIGNDTLGQQQAARGMPKDVYDILQKYRSRSGGVV